MFGLASPERFLMHFLLILMHFPLLTKVADNNTAVGEHVKYKITNENFTIELQS